MILWGMGISQHVHGTDNARCLIALTLMTGQVGRPGTGLHPLRGQNNVQGASDAGLIPMMFPDYQRVDNAGARAQFEALWGTTLDPKPGLTVVEIMDAVHAGKIRGMYIMGENPAMSDPDVAATRAQALAKLEMLVVQDIFLTETALPRRRDPAGVGVPREDRHLHQHRPHWCSSAARRSTPPGDARQDLWIIQSRSAQRLGPRLDTTRTRATCSTRCARRCRRSPASPGSGSSASTRSPIRASSEGDPGERVVFTEHFPTRDAAAARFVPADSHPRRRAARRRVSVRAHHRAPARALAHRQHDAPHRGARRDRAGAGRARSIRSTSPRSASRRAT